MEQPRLNPSSLDSLTITVLLAKCITTFHTCLSNKTVAVVQYRSVLNLQKGAI